MLLTRWTHRHKAHTHAQTEDHTERRDVGKLRISEVKLSGSQRKAAERRGKKRWVGEMKWVMCECKINFESQLTKNLTRIFRACPTEQHTLSSTAAPSASRNICQPVSGPGRPTMQVHVCTLPILTSLLNASARRRLRRPHVLMA